MDEKGLGAVVSKNEKVVGFIKAMPPPLNIAQYLSEEEYVAACRAEDKSSTKLSATQRKFLLGQGGQDAQKALDDLTDAVDEAPSPSRVNTPTTGRKSSRIASKK